MNDRRGFTLIEIVISLLIFSIMMGGLLSAGLVANTQLEQGQDDVQIWEVATYQMEKLIAMGYDSIKNGNDSIQGMRVDWKVLGNSPKTITVTIDRRTLNGKEKKAQAFVTLLADPADL